MSGEGEVESVADGKRYPIKPGTLYILDKHDKHILRAFEEMKMACVFNPALNGKEVHNVEGAYELNAEAVERGPGL
jgi:L-ectoine synthase